MSFLNAIITFKYNIIILNFAIRDSHDLRNYFP